MSEERLEQQFSEEITHYINGSSHIREKNEADSEEYEDLLELGKELSGKEDCDAACSQRLRGKFMMQLERENGEMKKVKSLKKAATVAVSVAAIGGVMA